MEKKLPVRGITPDRMIITNTPAQFEAVIFNHLITGSRAPLLVYRAEQERCLLLESEVVDLLSFRHLNSPFALPVGGYEITGS